MVAYKSIQSSSPMCAFFVCYNTFSFDQMATPLSFIPRQHCFWMYYCAATVIILLAWPWRQGQGVEAMEATKMPLSSSPSSHTVQLASLLVASSSDSRCNQSLTARSSRKGSTLQLVHKYGPCIQLDKAEAASAAATPSGFASHSWLEILLEDRIRVDSIHRVIAATNPSLINSAASANNESNGPSWLLDVDVLNYDVKFKKQKENQGTIIPLQSGRAAGVGNYLVKVGFGTPKWNASLIFDTGSAITWTQCEPCVGSCHQQMEAIFNPTNSTSYTNVSCSSASCKLITDAAARRGCSSTSTCLYLVQYADGGYSVGFFATEKLTVTSTDVFKTFLFGCGQNNADRFGRAAGVLGMGRSRLSFPSQTATKYGTLFSYCIPASRSSNGHLTFGGKVPKTVKFTPLSPSFQDTPFYGLDMTGISVGGTKLAINASVFATAGAVIDSGTVITRLPPKAYAAMSSKFQEIMKENQYPKTKEGYSFLDTCYDFSGHESVMFPRIGLWFKGEVEVDVEASGIMIAVQADLKKVCLAFAGNSYDDDVAIFGNLQQQTYEVVHDGARGRVGFVPAGCT